MRNFAVNQVTQLYVAKALQSDTLTAVGDIKIVMPTDNSELAFQYKGSGGVIKSDYIPIKNILDVRAISATQLTVPKRVYSIALDSNINGGKAVVGQDYILRIAFSHYLDMNDADQYFKYGAVHVTTATTEASAFYKKMAVSLAKNFSREPWPLVDIYLETTAGKVEAANKVTPYNEASLTGTYVGISIVEAEQEWFRGTKGFETVQFTVHPSTVTVEGDELTWGVVTDNTKKDTTLVYQNGKKTADFEYFCMGERGDQYRYNGWPNYVPTEYLVDPKEEYDYFNIHYYYEGAGESSQKSEKDLVIVATATSGVVTKIGNALKHLMPIQTNGITLVRVVA